MPAHTHTCATLTCGATWTCNGVERGAVCDVIKAAKVNKQGPFCDLCLHVEMAKRYAAVRGYVLRVNWPPEVSK